LSIEAEVAAQPSNGLLPETSPRRRKIFKPELAEKVLDGEKTETRRIVKEDETDCRYVPGRDYAVQPGRRRRAIGRIAITDVRKEKLGEITHEGAVREGFPTVRAFLDYWRRLHGHVDPE
jgi:hypothetical protein